MKKIFKQLNSLFERSSLKEITDDDKIVIFSDMHMGNGKKNDDFIQNQAIFTELLEKYYGPQKFLLMLNGDIEELHKFPLKKIMNRWKPIYHIFDQFQQDQRLVKIIGNHDYNLLNKKRYQARFPLAEAFKLKYKDNIIFLFHGHQAERNFRIKQPISTFIVRYIAHPLGIKNYSVAFNSHKRFKLEKKIYDFARGKKILAIIGHTHRPLFESLSKIDTLKFQIERFCRILPYSKADKQKILADNIHSFKKELEVLLLDEDKEGFVDNLYSKAPMVPCLFNSGCCIDENGVTAIEINHGKIELVYWFDKKRSTKYFDYGHHQPQQLEDSDYWRVSLKKEPLNYVFTRVNLLS